MRISRYADIKEKALRCGISRVEIERAANRVKVTIFTARPGGRGRGGTESTSCAKSSSHVETGQVNIRRLGNPGRPAGAKSIAAQ